MSHETPGTEIVRHAIRRLISDRLAYLVILDESRTYYVQFAPGFVGNDIDDLYGEAASSGSLEPHHALDHQQEGVLRRLGWMPPRSTPETVRANWWRYFELPSSDEDVERIAKAVVDTFTEVYRCDSANLHLEFAPHQG